MASIVFENPHETKSAHFQFGDDVPFGAEVAQAIDVSPAPDVKDLLRGVRHAIKALRSSDDAADATKVDGINNAFCNELVGGELSKREWGFSSNVMSWLARAKYNDLADFCQWNVARHKRHQTALDDITPKIQDNTRNATAALIDIGYFPTHAAPFMERSIQAAGRLAALDSFESGARNIDGHCLFNPETGELKIGIANVFWDTYQFQGVTGYGHPSTTFHEYLHGAGLVNDAGLLSGIDRPIIDGLSGYRWVEEMIVGHSERVAFDKIHDPHVLDPWRRTRLLGPYIAEREFGSALLEFGPDKLGAVDVANAFFASRDDPGQARRKLEDAIHLNFMHYFPEIRDGLNKINGMYEQGNRDEQVTMLHDHATMILEQVNQDEEPITVGEFVVTG